MAIHRSAMGKSVDMSALQARNEKVRAVGNMDVNARGDTIDSHGRIIKPVTAKVNNAYTNTVSKVPPREVTKPISKAPEPVMELTEAEKAMEAEFEDDELTEQIKKMELEQQQKKGKK